METIRMSSRGQVVIPKGMRKKINAKEGTLFAAIEEDGAIILQPIEIPARSDLVKSLEKLKHGISEMNGGDVSDAIHRVRSLTRTSSSQQHSGQKE